MMLQPRAFLYTHPSAVTPKGPKPERVVEKRANRLSAKLEHKDMASTSRPAKPTSDAQLVTPLPSLPVIIPTRGSYQNTVHDRRKSQGRKERPGPWNKDSDRARSRQIHSSDALPPAVAALLAITSIPRPKNLALPTRQGAHQKLTVDAIVENADVSEKTYGISVCKTPLDLLLNNWEEYDDETNESENGQESIISTRTFSSDSMPSLVDSIPESASPSSVFTPEFVPTLRRRRIRRVNSYSLSQECSVESHPLQAPDIDVEELDFRVFEKVADKDNKFRLKDESPRRKSAFKSNLTASLRALRSAARSLSSIKSPLLTPDDFLTRSIISIDPQVPFTDERMPPRLEDIPTPALRRYLNPTTNALIEAHVPPSRSQARRNPECTASIQMQTYKVSKTSPNTAHIVISRRTIPTQEDPCTDAGTGPLGRQREMRENSDFIRVAVMEMLMRKRGKLDDQKPGRARWALPPRKLPTRPYQIAPNGVPMRWIPTTM